jgi:hypothetical protein
VCVCVCVYECVCVCVFVCMSVCVITGGVSGTWINLKSRDDPSSQYGYVVLQTKSISWCDQAPSVQDLQLSSSGGNGGSLPPVMFISTTDAVEPQPSKAAVTAVAHADEDEDAEDTDSSHVGLSMILHEAPVWVAALSQQVVVQPAREFMVYHSRCVDRQFAAKLRKKERKKERLIDRGRGSERERSECCRCVVTTCGSCDIAQCVVHAGI